MLKRVFLVDCLGTDFILFFKLWGFLPLIESAADSTRPDMFFLKPHFLIFQKFFCPPPAVYVSRREDACTLAWDHCRLLFDVIKALGKKKKKELLETASPGSLCWLLFFLWPLPFLALGQENCLSFLPGSPLAYLPRALGLNDLSLPRPLLVFPAPGCHYVCN